MCRCTRLHLLCEQNLWNPKASLISHHQRSHHQSFCDDNSHMRTCFHHFVDAWRDSLKSIEPRLIHSFAWFLLHRQLQIDRSSAQATLWSRLNSWKLGLDRKNMAHSRKQIRQQRRMDWLSFDTIGMGIISLIASSHTAKSSSWPSSLPPLLRIELGFMCPFTAAHASSHALLR